MTTPSWIKVTPVNGGAGKTKISITCGRNSGAARSASVPFVTAGGAVKTLVVSQGAANKYVINISPKQTLKPITAVEDLSDFAYKLYHVDETTHDYEACTEANFMNVLSAGAASDLLVNWSPYGGINTCDYSFEYYPRTCLNPDAGKRVLARAVLNNDKTIITAVNQRVYNLRQAAFHQGSPIVEITVSMDEGIKIYTLAALYRSLYSDCVSIQCSNVFQAGLTASVGGADMIGDNLGYIWSESRLAAAARVTTSLSGDVLSENGVSRVFITGSIINSTNKVRILKWWTDGNGILKAFVSNGNQTNRFNPTAPEATLVSLTLDTFTGVNGIPSERMDSYLNPSQFYNPA